MEEKSGSAVNKPSIEMKVERGTEKICGKQKVVCTELVFLEIFKYLQDIKFRSKCLEKEWCGLIISNEFLLPVRIGPKINVDLTHFV